MKKAILYIIIIMLFPLFSMSNDCNYIMDDNRMGIIIQQMNNKSDDVIKLNIIKTYLQRLCINTDQMLSIMQVFESKDIQNQFFLYSEEYVIDLENYNKLKVN